MSDAADGHTMEQFVLTFSLVMTRVSSFIVASPILGRGTVPNTVKVGLCIALSIYWMPSYDSQMPPSAMPSTGSFVLALLMEFFVGMSLGYLVRLIILPTRIAGSYIGQELGFNLGQVADPTTGAATNEIGLLFDALGLLIFWVTDMHHTTLRMLGLSVESFRADREFVYGLAPVVAELFSKAHEFAFLMIAPLASILFLTLVSLMVVMRAWPQITLFSFGLGARLLIGLSAFFLLTPLIVTNMAQVFREVAQEIVNAVMVLRS